ncbi:hypothetical protein OE88DRAFT_1130143 [Heliocybe sulcata]|uniref:Uncharacterized protein n=1 Tax=Heliocybe sulcata TaxID=5364 RepID=A0A5C3NBT7_9AGAM|nr:hypothetical protein OE88DRAFT_1130143 [Heliocybe sulcata]
MWLCKIRGFVSSSRYERARSPPTCHERADCNCFVAFSDGEGEGVGARRADGAVCSCTGCVLGSEREAGGGRRPA